MLLDSEGTECAEADGQHDNQILTLIVLMASMLIYNSKGVPKRNDLNQLEYPFNQRYFRIRFNFYSFLLPHCSLVLKLLEMASLLSLTKNKSGLY